MLKGELTLASMCRRTVILAVRFARSPPSLFYLVCNEDDEGTSVLFTF